jgi:hypothetical protein
MMMKKGRQKLTLDQLATYEIKVPGEFHGSWVDWEYELAVSMKVEGDQPPVTTLRGTFDQAALHGLLRRLYSMGLPLISVICGEAEHGGEDL